MTHAVLAPVPPTSGEPLSVRHLGGEQGVDALLTTLVARHGSDLHLTEGSPPRIRVHGDLAPIPGLAPLTADEVVRMLRPLTTDEQWAIFEADHELDLAYELTGLSRFRVNLFQQRGAYGAVMRAIPHGIKPLEDLGVPDAVADFAHLPRGLVLVTGPTGSGKTTTLAAILDLANRTRKGHIVTVEDPIEFVHQHNRCLVNQREVGEDTRGFAVALKHALRQDPDIILVGELRDLETVSTALTAAETGHLVLATLHTQSAAQTVDRVIDIFPPHQQQEVRAQLSTALQGVVTQALVPRKDGTGRAVVVEIMKATPAIRNLIREGKNHQIPSFMQSSGEAGMQTFDQHLVQLVREGVISETRALEVAHSKDEMQRLLRGGVR